MKLNKSWDLWLAASGAALAIAFLLGCTNSQMQDLGEVSRAGLVGGAAASSVINGTPIIVVPAR